MHRRVDEPLSVFVVFRTPLVEDELLKTYLERLVVNVEAFAFSTAPPPEHEGKASPPKELIYAEPINQTNEPLVLRQGEGEAAYTYVIWKVEIFIGERNNMLRNRNIEADDLSATTRQVPQACHIFPTFGFIQTCRKAQAKCLRR